VDRPALQSFLDLADLLGGLLVHTEERMLTITVLILA
jgi:hypothetical protein